MAQHSRLRVPPASRAAISCIKGTRTPVRAIVEYDSIYDGDTDEILEALPHLTREQIEAARDYYRDCPELVDKDIERQWKAALDLLTLDVSKSE